jgi:hypothetical protein
MFGTSFTSTYTGFAKFSIVGDILTIKETAVFEVRVEEMSMYNYRGNWFLAKTRAHTDAPVNLSLAQCSPACIYVAI